MVAKGFTYVSAGILLLAILWSPAAHAYIDGGTASMIFQMLIAGGLAAMLTMKSFWARAKSFFDSLGKKPPPNKTGGSGRREA